MTQRQDTDNNTIQSMLTPAHPIDQTHDGNSRYRTHAQATIGSISHTPTECNS